MKSDPKTRWRPQGQPPSFKDMLTLYGRKPVLEVIGDQDLKPWRLHIDKQVPKAGIIAEILRAAEQRGLGISWHTRQSLSRISKNGRQDQGVALDVQSPHWSQWQQLVDDPAPDIRLLALNRITNPQNLGMIIRTVAASPLSGLLVPRTGCARIDALVIKASAGTLFRAPLYFCDNLIEPLSELSARNFEIIGLDSEGTTRINELTSIRRSLMVLGNETDGLDEDITPLCDQLVRIPLRDGIESLNVSAAAAVVAFSPLYAMLDSPLDSLL